jgi:hypothetical protein
LWDDATPRHDERVTFWIVAGIVVALLAVGLYWTSRVQNRSPDVADDLQRADAAQAEPEFDEDEAKLRRRY